MSIARCNRNPTPSVKKIAHSKEYLSKPYTPKRSSSDNRRPNCKPTANKDSANFSNISLHSCSSTPNQSAILKLAVNGTWGTACADNGASHTIAGESLYLLLQRDGANFQKNQLSMSFADGQKSEVEVYTSNVIIRLEGRVIRTPLIALHYAKENRTLLVIDFL
ncbi:hypothetical protein NPIL_21501 [Nephila pilipes]|uniref:Uncharacterized protein n=1 Tax=Nephila pilipes TaxID=299642 RepID=A0A8X6UAN3_NEPPI|nr:hypothetical protein NPIL_21501 [Nephila pilipes]